MDMLPNTGLDLPDKRPDTEWCAEKQDIRLDTVFIQFYIISGNKFCRKLAVKSYLSYVFYFLLNIYR
jgi:hypothetical protein